MRRWPVNLMTKLIALVLAISIFAVACGGGTETNPEKLIPEGSNLIAQVNLAGILSSDAVASVVASLQEKDDSDPPSLDELFDQAIGATGIDFRQVSRLVFFGDVSRDDEFPGLILKGTFNEVAILEVLARLEGKPSTSVYKGRRVYGPDGDAEGPSLAFLEGDILVLGTIEAVRAVIDVQEGDRRRVSGAVPDALADLGHGLLSLAVEVPSEELPDQLSDLGDIPFFGDSSQALSAILEPLQDLEILGLALAQNGQILILRVNLDFASEDSASSVGNVLNGILTLASGLIPDAEVRDLLENLEVSSDGSRLTLRLEVAASEIGSLVGARGESQPQPHPQPRRVSVEAESLETSILSLMVDKGLTSVSVPTTATNDFTSLDFDPGPGVAYLLDYLRQPTTNLSDISQIRLLAPMSLKDPYHKDQFTYNEPSDSFTCPQGQTLKFIRIQHTNGVPLRLYRASEAVCQVCPAFGVCTRAKEIGRSLAIGPHDAVLRRHRAWMSTSAAREAYKLRKQLVEPVFGIIKEQQGARRFLLRGLVNVAAEWTMLATAFNLRTLWRVWRSSPFIGLFNGPEPCPVS